jgi:hypothetical protein
MNRKIVRGRTEKDRFDSVEHALASLQRRNPKAHRALLPPVPIFLHCKDPAKDGTVGQLLIPFHCTLTNALVHIGTMRDKELTLTIESNTPNALHAISTVVKENLTTFEKMDWPLEYGTLILCKVEYWQLSSNISMAFLVSPNIEYYMQIPLEGRKDT